MNPKHLAKSAEWYTPVRFVLAARATMGGIDLDPASCVEANDVIQAGTFYTKEDNGLVQAWAGNIFLNPPTGLVKQFWTQLMIEWYMRNIEQAIWIGYSLEQLQTLQNTKAAHTPLDFSMCVPRKRIQFDSTEGSKNSPTHGNYITYMGQNKEMFALQFQQFGQVVLR